MGGAIGILLVIPFNNTSEIRNTSFRPLFQVFYWILIAVWFVLTWIGQSAIDDVFAFVGVFCTFYYYVFFILLIPIVGKIESTLACYEAKN
jgi:ubiquinol-cytochrome c reductase cytochrome b subunit